MTDQTADRAAAPVKQRADCTETEWAEQERARFERLYTRETVRADTAARDADIYQKRLERLGEGYTKQRQRAEQAEAEAERLRTDRAAACICGHTEAQHFEDACLVCDCGDYLVPEAAREVIARWRAAATRAPADQAAVLRELADLAEDCDGHLTKQELRRMAWSAAQPAPEMRCTADEAQQPEAPDVVAAIVAALQERAGELSELAEEQMRPSLEERAQEWLEAAEVARRAAKAADEAQQPREARS